MDTLCDGRLLAPKLSPIHIQLKALTARAGNILFKQIEESSRILQPPREAD